MLPDILCVACGGAAGAIARYLLQSIPIASDGKIYITMGINLAGCLIIGILCALFSSFQTPAWLNRLLVTGFLGGFTTFSAFALESVATMQAGRLMESIIYIGVSVAGGILLCALGLLATRQIIG